MNTTMKKITSFLLMLTMIITICGDILSVPVFAAVDYVSANRSVDLSTIYATDEIEVKLSVTGTPPSKVIMPNDIILVLDKSGSMQMAPDPARFTAMIESAKEFIDLVDFNSHQVGVVDYSGNGQIGSYPLTTDGDAAKAYIDGITCGGGTYTHDAIKKGTEMLVNTGREEAQPVMILLTDGEPNSEALAIQAATKAKEAGIVFYTIALLGPDVDPATSKENLFLQELATTASHHHFVLGSVGLIDIYRAIVKEIGVAAAYNVKITETVSDEFEIVPGSYSANIPTPTVDRNTLTWDILELKANTLEFTYKIRLKDQSTRGIFNISNGSNITYDDYMGTSNKVNLGATNVTVKDYAPIITDITPSEGLVEGGEAVIIKGENFRDGLTVTFANVAATDVVVVDSQTITLKTPVGKQGIVTVTVINDDNQKATTAYTYKANPTITAVTPNTGVFVGGNKVTIKGTSFVNGAKVFLGDQEATSTTFFSTSSLYAIVPAAVEAGSVDVKVVNPDGTFAVLEKGYTYQEEVIIEMKILSLSVKEGPVKGGTVVSISGENFESGSKVFFGDQEATVSLSNAATYKVTTPAAPEGIVDVTIVAPSGKTATLEDAFTYYGEKAPEIYSIDTTSGELVGGEYITITGDNFKSGLVVKVGQNEAVISNFYSAQKLRIKAPAATAAGVVSITIINPSGLSGSLADCYKYLEPTVVEYPAPEIISLDVTSGELVGGEYIVVNGANFQDGMTVTLCGNNARVTNRYSASKIRIQAPVADEAGSTDLTVTNPDGKSATLASAYEYLPEPEPEDPTITSLSITEGELKGGEYVTINGTNFEEGLTVYFGSEVATLNNFYSALKIRVKAPASITAGAVDVRVVNPSGKEATLANAYTYLEAVPTITSITPASGELAGGEYVTINGTNLIQGLTVYFGDEEAKVSNFYSTLKIRVKAPVATVAGTVDIRIVNPDGSEVTLADGYEYLPKPAEPVANITKLTSGSTASAAEITSAAKGSYVYAHGTTLNYSNTVKIVDAAGVETTFKANNVYSALKIRFKIPTTIASGDAVVSLINSDGVESNTVTLTIN